MDKYALTAQQLRLAKLEYEVLQAQADAKKKEYEALRKQLCNDMVSNEILKFNIAKTDTEPGMSFRLESKERWSPVVEEKGALFNVLRSEAPDLFTVLPATLNKFINNQIEAYGQLPPQYEGLVKKYDDTHVVVRITK